MAPHSPSPATARALFNDSTRKRVLIIEDEPDLRRTLTMRLGAAGYEVATVSDGRAAMATVMNVWPDLILLDIGLPGVDGHAVANQLKVDGKLQFPIIVLSARSEIDDRIQAAESGVVAYLVKPYDPDMLMKAVRVALGEVPPLAAPAPSAPGLPRLSLHPSRSDEKLRQPRG